MTDYNNSGQEASESNDERRDTSAVAKRVARAFDEFFHIEPAAKNGEYAVFSGSGNTYTVTMPAGACTCPDGQRGAWCKHAFRVAFVTGELPEINSVRAESDEQDRNDEPTDSDENDEKDGETLFERIKRYKANNPDASAIEVLAQLDIHPSQKAHVEEVLA